MNKKRKLKNIEFVHSLGLKCDSVGWCDLDLNRFDIDDLLEKINVFALQEGLYLRGYYDREPEGYYIHASETIPYPSDEVIIKLELDYEKLMNNPKPERKVSEKDALKLFRSIDTIALLFSNPWLTFYSIIIFHYAVRPVGARSYGVKVPNPPSRKKNTPSRFFGSTNVFMT